VNETIDAPEAEGDADIRFKDERVRHPPTSILVEG
jgi:hypothetical protein